MLSQSSEKIRKLRNLRLLETLRLDFKSIFEASDLFDIFQVTDNYVRSYSEKADAKYEIFDFVLLSIITQLVR